MSAEVLLETARTAAQNISDASISFLAVSAIQDESVSKLEGLRKGAPRYVLDKLEVAIRSLQRFLQLRSPNY